jgi:Ras-related protein Rab-1A
LTSSYYRGAHGIIVVYDVTDKTSFENVKNWMQEIDKFANDNVQILVVGNKADCEERRKVSKEQGEELAKMYNLHFMESSAKTGLKVDEIFTTISKEILQSQQKSSKTSEQKPNNRKLLTVNIDGKKTNCCT